MLVRRLIGVLAVSGVLLHVGALVHHNAVMVEAQFQHNALLADLGRICHGAGEEGTVGSLPRGALRCVERCRSSATQLRRSETCSWR